MSSILNIQINKKIRPRRYLSQIFILISLMITISIFLMMNLSTSDLVLEEPILSEKTSISSPNIDIIFGNSSTQYIYIDIGCFNGETIEHFIHFIPNSQMYTIITFEPDPYNYQLCKQRLTQEKFSNINIIILQKVVWIRDEKVFFRTNHGQHSRIVSNKTSKNTKYQLIQLDAIDFSSWLARLAKPNNTKISIKMSIPGAEVAVLRKMLRDETLGLAEKYEIEWSDRSNVRHTATRIYIQLMLDTCGFDCLYYTRIEDARDTYKINGTFNSIKKYYNWKLINSSETYAHYNQRPDVIEPLYKLKQMKK